MLLLGHTYFWKFLYNCDPVRVEDYGETLCSTLSEAMRREYRIVQPDSSDREVIRRWSAGGFSGLTEQNLKFPRVFYVFQWLSGSTDERWTADIFFTRVPHIRGIYSNVSNKHRLGRVEERELSVRLVESHLADTFLRAHDNTWVGNTAGLYVFQKLHHIASLKEYAEGSRYVPPGSDLQPLLERFSAILPEGDLSTAMIEIPQKRAQLRAFLEKCDRRVVSCLGIEQLQRLLGPVDVAAKTWFNAGKGGLFSRLFAG